MTQPLHTRLQHIRRRVRQVLWLHGLSWLVAVVFGAALLAGMLDWLVHLNEPSLRLVLGLGILAAGGWVAWRFLAGPLLRPLPDVEIARRIEHRYPAFKDSLSSTVQFLEAGTDPRLGSPVLQRQVIADTLGRVERVDMADVVELRGVRKVAGAAIAVCLLTATVVALNQSAAAVALHRLVAPFSAPAWPKKTWLRLVDGSFRPVEHDPHDPLRIARGDTLGLYVENLNGGLPDDLVIEYRFERFSDGETTAERVRRATLRDAEGRPREVGALGATVSRGPMWFRAVGGDDRDMPWYEVHVVPPPVVDDFRVRLTPPAYSGRDTEDLPAGVGHVQGLVGTRVDLVAGVNKPLRSARLRIKDRPPLDVQLAEDGRRLRTSFTIDEPGVYSYWFDLTDREGFENADAPRYEIRGIADLVPEVAIERPATDQHVTADASVPLRIAAKDDLGLTEVRLMGRLNGSEDAVLPPLVLFAGPERPDQLSLRHVWELASLSLSEGMRITFHAEATDAYDLGPPHVGRSVSRTLTVVSSEEKAAELAARQAQLLDELERIHNTQTQAREQTAELLVQLQKAGRLRPEDVDLLRRIELDQRQIASRLTGPTEGIEARARALTAELRDNRIDDPEMSARLEQIADELGFLRSESLPTIERELTRARKGAQLGQHGRTDPSDPPGDETERPATAPPEQAGSLSEAEEHQGVVLESLGEMLRQLSQWRNQRDLARDVEDLIEAQEQVNRESAAVGRRTLARPHNELTPQEQADLARVAGRQARQAERLDQLRGRLGEMARRTAETSPSAAEPLADAEDFLRRQATSGRMREAAEHLDRNSVGEATARQQEALSDLAELQDILRNRGASDLETLVRKLRQAEEQLESLRKRQEELRKQVEQATDGSDDRQRRDELEQLRREQRQLREEAAGMARQLRRLQASRPGQSTRRAADRMQRAEQDLADDAGDRAGEQQQQALDDLEQAQRELARQRQAAEERLAREMLERIADELKEMIARQQNVVDETARLEDEHRRRGNWIRAQLRSLLDLAEVQRGLKDETDRLAERVQAAEVFALALRGAARQMQTTADRLAARQTDETTLQSARAARQRFVDLIAALESEQGESAAPQAGGPQGDQPQDGPQTDGIPHLAQLRMLKTLQEDLLTRTGELDRLREENGGLTDDQQSELDLLALEQGQLADLARNLIQAATEAFGLEQEGEEP